jgi:hypothetical protein
MQETGAWDAVGGCVGTCTASDAAESGVPHHGSWVVQVQHTSTFSALHHNLFQVPCTPMEGGSSSGISQHQQGTSRVLPEGLVVLLTS